MRMTRKPLFSKLTVCLISSLLLAVYEATLQLWLDPELRRECVEHGKTSGTNSVRSAMLIALWAVY